MHTVTLTRLTGHPKYRAVCVCCWTAHGGLDGLTGFIRDHLTENANGVKK